MYRHDTGSVSVILNPAAGGMKNLFRWEKAKSIKMNFDDPTGNGFSGWVFENSLMVKILRSAGAPLKNDQLQLPLARKKEFLHSQFQTHPPAQAVVAYLL